MNLQTNTGKKLIVSMMAIEAKSTSDFENQASSSVFRGMRRVSFTISKIKARYTQT